MAKAGVGSPPGPQTGGVGSPPGPQTGVGCGVKLGLNSFLYPNLFSRGVFCGEGSDI